MDNTEALLETFKDSSILVMGAAGFIGSETVRQLLTFQPKHLILCDQAESPLHEITLEAEDLSLNTQIHSLLIDVTNSARLMHIFELYRPDYVFHCAFYKHSSLAKTQPYEAISVNIGGTQKIAEISAHFDVKQFIMVSSHLADSADCRIGKTLRLAEAYLSTLNKKYTHQASVFKSIRLGSILTSQDTLVHRFQKQIQKGEPLTIDHPTKLCHFLTKYQAVSLVLNTCLLEEEHTLFRATPGPGIQMKELAQLCIQMSGYRENKDIQILYPAPEKLEGRKNRAKALPIALPTGHPDIHCLMNSLLNAEEAKESILALLEDSDLYEPKQLSLLLDKTVKQICLTEDSTLSYPNLHSHTA